jgi:3-hydroxyisobutyrate dehydrogenase-like beta-hydroxyacid dehydrogenase
MQLAFVGLGAMGHPMTANLAKAGFTVRAWNRTEHPFPELTEAGVRISPSLAAAVSGADLVCLCLLNDEAVETVFAQMLPHLKAGTVVVDHSTVGVGTVCRLAAAASAQGVHYLDAPVSGGAAGAAAATLTIMVGGERTAYERVAPALQAMGRLVVYLGPSGSGAAAKLVNQLLTAANQAAAAEALHLGARFGLDLQRLHTILAASFGASRMVDRSLPVLQSDQFDSPFKVDVLVKDLGLILDFAASSGVQTPMAEASLAQYQRAQGAGLGGSDAAVLVKLLNR